MPRGPREGAKEDTKEGVTSGTKRHKDTRMKLKHGDRSAKKNTATHLMALETVTGDSEGLVALAAV